MIDPNKELFYWGPIDGKIIYIESFMDYMVKYQDKLKKSWPDLITHFKDNKVLMVIEYPKLREYGQELFKEYILDSEKCKKNFTFWLELAERIAKLCFYHKNSDLSTFSNKQLKEQLTEFYELYETFWVYGFIPEISNWGGEKILMDHINEHYSNDFNEMFEVLTAPEQLSFYQVEEKELLTEDLQKHAQKYFWINNSYGGVNFVTPKMFKKRKAELSQDKLDEINNFLGKIKKRKEEVQNKFNISEEIVVLASKLSYSIWWQDLRKKYIFMALHIIHHFATEIANRNKISLQDIELYEPKELLKLAETGNKINLTERKEGYMSYYHQDKNFISYKFGEEANKIMGQYTNVEVDKNIKEIKGLSTSKGKITGKVRILSGSRHFDSMRDGEILVTSMTSPEFIVAMRKAAAIITDEGGITCHAAIVSRELGLPCVVATKIATRVLKTGDLVEVDAYEGTVKRL